VVEKSSNSPVPELWHALLGIRSPQTYSPDKPLFACGQPTRGVYLVEKGKVKLFLCSEPGAPSFDEVGPGSVLGLSEAISGTSHKLTAVASDRAQISFVDRKDLLTFLQQNQFLCLQLVRLLSEDLHLLYHRFRSDPRTTEGARIKSVRETGPPARVN
jgi:CRP-like cAMP-binding protein